MMDIAAGVQAAADLKVNKNDLSKPLFNAGILYKSPFGSTNVSYSELLLFVRALLIPF